MTAPVSLPLLLFLVVYCQYGCSETKGAPVCRMGGPPRWRLSTGNPPVRGRDGPRLSASQRESTRIRVSIVDAEPIMWILPIPFDGEFRRIRSCWWVEPVRIETCSQLL